MYCSQCGKEILGNARYCPACGARQEMGVVSAEETLTRRSADRKKGRQEAHRYGRQIGNFLVSVIALLILFTGEKEIPDTAVYTLQQMDGVRFTAQNQREMAVCNEKGTVYTIDIPRQLLYSGEHAQMAYVDQDGELYYMKDMTPVFIDDAVSTAEWSFYGDTIVYVRDGESGKNELCIYERKTQSCDRTTVTGCREFAISPDGKTVACAEPDGTLLLWHSGSQTSIISRNVSEIFALSDEGKMILYRKDGDRLYLYADSEETEAASISGNINCVLNASQTELLYSDEGGVWYYSADLEEPMRLSGVKGDLLTTCYMADTAYQQNHGLILEKRTLRDMTFAVRDRGSSSYKIYHLDSKGKNADAVLNYADQFHISKNGESLLYLSGQKLYHMKNIKDSQSKVCLSGTMNVSQFITDPRHEKIWFSTSDQELYNVKRDECISLSSDLSQICGFCANGILFQEGHDLYFADGEEKLLLKENIDYVSIQENNYVIIGTDGELYYLKDLDESISLMSSR